MRSLVLGTAFIFTACGPSDRTGGETIDASSTDSGGSAGSDAQQQMPTPSRVFAHSGTTLYRVDASTYAPSKVGDLKQNGNALQQSITDIAIDINDRMLGITLDKLYEIDEMTGAVTLVTNLPAAAQGFQSLSFVADPADDSKDIMIAANFNGDVYKIDTTTGAATKIGSYGTVASQVVKSSGDIIGVRGFGIYATVKIGNDTSQDYLAKIDPMNGWKATPLGAGVGFKDIFGLAFWEGTIFGFVAGTTGGNIVKIDANTGAGTEVQGGAERWFGAGVATDAPIL